MPMSHICALGYISFALDRRNDLTYLFNDKFFATCHYLLELFNEMKWPDGSIIIFPQGMIQKKPKDIHHTLSRTNAPHIPSSPAT